MLHYLVLYLTLISQRETLGFQNVALHKSAYQINTRWSANASLAVDGNTNQTFWKGKSCSLTHTNSSPYWYIDLAAIFEIDHVVIYKRMDPCCSGRLRDVELYIGKTNDSYTKVANHSDVLDPVFTFQLPPAIKGRWVKIYKVGITGYLSLCEVQIMAHSVAYGGGSKVDSQKGSSNIVSALRVGSAIQCVYQCSKVGACKSLNLRGVPATNSLTCELLDGVDSIASTEADLDFFVVS